MKIALMVAGGVVAAIVAVAGIGWLLPKRHIVSRSAVYRARPEQLFGLIAGAQNWRPDVLRWEAVPGADGRELARETTRGGETVTYELLESEAPRALKRRIATENLPYSGTWTYSIQGEGANTVVRITEDGEVYNPMFRFVSRFVIGQTRTMDEYLRALGLATGEKVRVREE